MSPARFRRLAGLPMDARFNQPEEGDPSNEGGSAVVDPPEGKAPKEESPEEPERTHRLVGPDGKMFVFSDDEFAQLAGTGLAKMYQDMAEPQDKKTETAPTTEGDVKEVTAADVMKRFDEFEKREANKEQRRQLEARKVQISEQIGGLLGAQELLADNQELYDFALKSVLREVAEKPSVPLKKHVEGVMKLLSGGRSSAQTEYAKSKKQDREATRGVKGSGEGAPIEGEDKQYTAKDFKNGTIRKNLIERLKKNKSEPGTSFA